MCLNGQIKNFWFTFIAKYLLDSNQGNQPLFNSVQYPGLVAPKKTRQIAAVQASVQAGHGPGALFSVYMQ